MDNVKYKFGYKCLKDVIKYKFSTIEDHKKFYVKEIYKLLSIYDSRVIMISYIDYVCSRYNYLYYIEHREREILIGFLQMNGIQTEFSSYKDIINAIPPKKEMKRFYVLLSKYNSLLYVDEEFVKKASISKSFYELYKSPEFTTRFKTNYIRNMGSGKQYINHIQEILILMDARLNTKLSRIVDGFSMIYEFAIISNKRLEQAKDSSYFNVHNNLERIFGIKEKNKFSTLYLLMFFRRNWLISLNNMSQTVVYTEGEINDIFLPNNMSIIKKMSFRISESQEQDLWVDNPLIKHPFVKIGNLYYYYVQNIHLTFLEEALINAFDSKLKDTYYKVKTETYLEEKVYSILLSKYKNANIYKNLKFYKDNILHETDILFIYNNFVAVIEVKGTGLTSKGHKGDKSRLDTQIKKIISRASKQASLFAGIIQLKKNSNMVINNKHKTNLDFSKIEKVITLSISFEWLIFFSLGMHSLREKHQISNSHIHMALVELEDIVDVFDNEEQFLYYLYKRSLLEESSIPVRGDECDLMYHYVHKSFAFQFDHALNCYDVTGEFDKQKQPSYFTVKYSLFPGDKVIEKFKNLRRKPTISQTAFYQKIIDYANRSKHKNNLFLMGYLYSVPMKMQNEFEKQIKKALTDKENITLIGSKIDLFSPRELILIYKEYSGSYNQFISKYKKQIKKSLQETIIFVFCNNLGLIQLRDILYIKPGKSR